MHALQENHGRQVFQDDEFVAITKTMLWIIPTNFTTRRPEKVSAKDFIAWPTSLTETLFRIQSEVARLWILNKPVVIMHTLQKNHGRQVFQDDDISIDTS